MRLLVACPNCNCQYDASKLSLGQQFRCHCGTVLTVQKPRGHDAAVVCCSHCGAPRSEGALKCEYCGADFTLHERDLDTVCPHCFARVSNHARFCHFCGKPISPEMIAGQASKLVCPACGSNHTLTSRAWGAVSAMECQRCAGLWLGNQSFEQLTEQAATEATTSANIAADRGNHPRARAPQVESPPPDTSPGAMATARSGHAHDTLPLFADASLAPAGQRYRPCAVCGQLMVRQNFGHHSGVMIDRCKQHGLWFDADELPRILDWVRHGGLAQITPTEAARQYEQELTRKNALLDGMLMEKPLPECDSPTFGDSLMTFVLAALARLLFWRH
jgi:Zn-finger nucleic acid-binding protein